MFKFFVAFIFCFSLISSSFFSQEESAFVGKKGSFYAYWGWNRSCYTNSDITFTGRNYDFTLENVIANDRQSKFNFETYFSPTKLTIPQYNFRFGYFLNDKYSLSFGADHMKYVMKNYQVVSISGSIKNSDTEFDGEYDKTPINLVPEFLKFEHTDGLNYENIELRRHVTHFEKEKVSINSFYGGGIGVLIPRTNTTLMKNERYDEFHISGFGLGAVLGLNVEFFKHFFIQFEGKFGYINMPDIRTTQFKVDRAKQDFFFAQFNGLFGARFKFKK